MNVPFIFRSNKVEMTEALPIEMETHFIQDGTIWKERHAFLLPNQV